MASSKQLIGTLSRSVDKFVDMADLPTFEERKKALLAKCDQAYAVAQVGRGRTVEKGDKVVQLFDPDTGGMVKCIELAARLMGVLAEAERRAKDGEGESRGVEIEQLISLIRSIGYRVEKAP